MDNVVTFPKPHSIYSPYDSLSFTAGPGNLWVPERTGDHAMDCATGKRCAQELLDFMRQRNAPMALGFVCAAMPEIHTGAEIGFFSELAITAMEQ